MMLSRRRAYLWLAVLCAGSAVAPLCARGQIREMLKMLFACGGRSFGFSMSPPGGGKGPNRRLSPVWQMIRERHR